MLRRLKAFFNFNNFCNGCELYSEVLVALGWLEVHALQQNSNESEDRR
jgi:hypothetical protein